MATMTDNADFEKVLVIGFSMISIDEGNLLIKNQVANYLYELRNHFEDVYFMASALNSEQCSTPLDTKRVTPVILDRKNPLSLLQAYNFIARNIDNNTAVIIHTPYTPSMFLLPILWAKSGTIIGYMASDPRDVAKHQNNKYNILSYLKSIVIRMNGELIFALSDRLLIRGKKENYENKHSYIVHSNPIIQLPNVETSSLESSNCFHILYVGSLQERKGVDILIDSLSNIIRENSIDIKLEIIGEGPQKRKLQDMVEERNISDYVVFVDYIDNMQTLAYHYISSDLVVVPSRQVEGSPRVIDEAQYYGTPVIASDLDYADSLTHEENIYYFESGSSERLTNAIKTIIRDDQLKKRLIKSGFERMKNIAQETAAEQHAKVIGGCKQ